MNYNIYEKHLPENEPNQSELSPAPQQLKIIRLESATQP